MFGSDSDLDLDYPLSTSTPIRTDDPPLVSATGPTSGTDSSLDIFVIGSPVQTNLQTDSSLSFEFLAGARNRPRRVLYTDSEADCRLEPNNVNNWIDRPLSCMKYVDDCLSIEKLPFLGGERVNANGVENIPVRAVKSESHFRTVEYNAERKGMQINALKTKMFCISNAWSYLPHPYLLTTDGTVLRPSETLKILGCHFSSVPTVREHLRVMLKKFKCRIWSLRHLKRNGFTQGELVRAYVAMIRPYCSVVFHSLITQSDSNELERVQGQALKVIFGWKHSYRELLAKSGLERLETRREARFIKLAEKMSESPRFSTWFPRQLYRGEVATRRREKFKIYPSTTERYKRSPLNQMRRRLNDLVE